MFDSGYSKIAYKIAQMAHEGQIDKAGKPYINHPIAVAQQLSGDRMQAVALLHDVMEDCPDYDEKRLALLGISDDIIQSLKLLCHKDYDGMTYMEYIHKIKDSGDKVAVTVKIADLKHNSDLSRFDHPSERDYYRLKRYKKALKVLQDA